MKAVKVLPKGQITLPKEIRGNLGIKIGDTLILEKSNGKVILKKGKTIHHYIGFLPKPDISIEDVIEKSVEEAVREHEKDFKRIEGLLVKKP